MWVIATLVAAILGLVFGWTDPSDYFGAIPRPVAAALMGVFAIFCVNWFLKRAAEHEGVSPIRAFVGGAVGAVAVPLMMNAAGYAGVAPTAGPYLGFVCGIGAAIYPALCLGAAVFGAVIGGIDTLLDGHLGAGRRILETSVVFAFWVPLLWSTHKVKHLPKKRGRTRSTG